MSKYTEILEKVQSYLQEDNTRVNNGEISLFDLYGIVDETVKEVYKRKEGEELLAIVNKENSIINKVGRFFKKKEICDRYSSLHFMLDEKDVGICFYDCFRGDSSFDVYKDSESGELYTDGYKQSIANEILEKHYDEIYAILTGLEEFRNLTGISESYGPKNVITQVIDDGFMNVNIKVDYYGRIHLGIGVSKTADPDGVSKRNYYGKDVIQNIINNNGMIIAKNMPIDENELTLEYKKILIRRKNKKEDNK